MTKSEYWKKYDESILCEYYSNDFDIWWDKERFNYDGYSEFLCIYIPDKFNIWWDSNKFDPEKYNELVFFVLHKIAIWWNSDYTDVFLDTDILYGEINYWEWNYD